MITSSIKTPSTKITTPSIPSSSPPTNLASLASVEEYLELKKRRARRIVLESDQGKDDMQILQIPSEEYKKVKALRGYANMIFMNLSHDPISDADLKKLLKEYYLNYIMVTKPYEVEKDQFNGWPTKSLLDEIVRMEKLKLFPNITPSTPNWKDGKKPNDKRALKMKRMKEELVAANRGTMETLAKWNDSTTFKSYKQLDIQREKDPSLPKRLEYEQQDFPINTLINSSEFHSARIIAKAARKFIKKKHNLKKDTRKEDLACTIKGRPVSPKSSEITLVPANLPSQRILKRKSGKDTYELTLLRASGEDHNEKCLRPEN
ncbi:hypothetical protein Hanom_Chr14g01294951 [Helianthus anomalus]